MGWLQAGILGAVLFSTVHAEALPFSARAAQAAEEAGKVGLVTRNFVPTAPRNWRGVEKHVLHTLIWYPAAEDAVEQPQMIGTPELPIFEAGDAMPHAPFAPALKPLPVVLLSHNSGGSAEQMGWLGTALARAGYLVAAVEQPGDNSVDGITAEGSTLWWERATDLSEVLDGLLADSELGPHIDKQRVGAAGFSMGGYTVMELAGARTDISALYDLCDQTPDDPVCHTPEMKTLGTPEHVLSTVRTTSGESLARSGESYRDPRIRAVFVIAPALGFTLTPESLKTVKIPVALVAGGADTVDPLQGNSGYLHAHLHGAKLTVLPDVDHYAFLDICTVAGRATAPKYCTDSAGVSRSAVHRQVEGLALDFFDRTLRP